MSRRLTVLGTASQAPTVDRRQGGYLLEWDREKVLFDPGEGSQVQLLRSGCAPARVTHICISHFHGDHCLGLPGVVLSHAQARDRPPLRLHYLDASRPYVDRLLAATALDCAVTVDHVPMSDGSSRPVGELTLTARMLDHATPAIGYRLEEPERWHLVPDRLDEHGVHGPDRRRILAQGEITLGRRTVTLDQVGEIRAGLTVAFIMDTRPCASARLLAAGADLLICESTFLAADGALAAEHGHMTATDAAELARAADVGLLVLSHFSARYPDSEAFEHEARPTFAATLAAHDLQRIPVRRRIASRSAGRTGPSSCTEPTGYGAP